MPDRWKGYLITLCGVLIITPDALLLRLIQADPWIIMFWRGLGFFAVQFLIVLITHRQNTFHALLQTGRIGVLIAVTMAIGQILFVQSIHNTQAANTLVIIAAIPLATSALAYFWLGERIARRTLISGILVLIAVSLTMAGGLSVGGTLGDLAAIGVVVCLAIIFVGLRKTAGLDMLPAIAMSGLISASIAAFASNSLNIDQSDFLFMLLLCLIVSPLSFVLISIGPRYLPAPEVALLLLVETALGPLWVWLVLKEAPTPWTLAGGALMIATLTVNSWLLLRRNPKKV